MNWQTEQIERFINMRQQKGTDDGGDSAFRHFTSPHFLFKKKKNNNNVLDHDTYKHILCYPVHIPPACNKYLPTYLYVVYFHCPPLYTLTHMCITVHILTRTSITV